MYHDSYFTFCECLIHSLSNTKISSMHLVIMAAWEGSRMRPLTDTTPKPLLKICGKTIIEHNIENIVENFEDIFFIVKYKQDAFPLVFWESYRGHRVHYIEQIDTLKGTWAAILSLKWHIKGEFVVVSGDDLYESEDIRELSKKSGFATLCKRVDRPEDFGIFHTDPTGKALGIIEKPTDPTLWNLANIWNHKFDDSIFEELASTPLSPRGELEITSLIDVYIRRGRYSVVEAKGRWITIWYPWDLLKANDEIIWKYTENINKWAIIEPQVSINGNVFLEEGVILKSWTYIEWNVYIGRNAVIGPHAYVRWNTSIGEWSKIGFSVEVKNSYIGDATSIPHLSYIGDSILGNNVNIWGGSKIANLRHDNENIKVMLKEKLIDTGRRKLWGIIWDHSHLGINTLIYPGRTLPTWSTTLPWEVITGKNPPTQKQ